MATSGEVLRALREQYKKELSKPVSTRKVKSSNGSTVYERLNVVGDVVETNTITSKGNMVIEKKPVISNTPSNTEYVGTFINDRGQGFSQNPDTVVRSVDNKAYGYKDVSYYSGRTERVNTGTNNIYGREMVTNTSNPMFTPSVYSGGRKGLLKRGYNNISLLDESLGERNREIQSKMTSDPLTSPLVSPEFLVNSGKRGLIGGVKFITTPILYPKETAIGLYMALKTPKKTAINMWSEFKDNPLGTIGGFWGTGKLLRLGEAGLVLGRNSRIALTTKTVPYSNYLDVGSAEKVLAGEKAFPLSSSIKDTQLKFNLGKTDTGFKVTTVSDNPIRTLGQNLKIVVGKGTGIDRTEGLYVSPYTQGSAYFFRVKAVDGYTYSLLPKFNSKPTLSIINVGKIERIPKPILKGGVESENLFLETQGIGGTNTAFITGNLERRFNSKLPEAFKTSETEAVIPVGSILNKVGRDTESFKFSFYRVPVKEYALKSEDVSLIGTKGKGFSLGKIGETFKTEGKLDTNSMTYYLPKRNKSLVGSVGKSLVSSTASSVSSSSISRSYSSIGSSSGSSSYSSNGSSSYTSKSSSSISRSYTSIGSSNYSRSNSLSSSSISRGSSSYSYPKITTTTPKLNFKGGSNGRSFKPFNFGKLSNNFKPKYTPSIEATIFNVRAKKVNQKLTNTGLVIRPIVEGL